MKRSLLIQEKVKRNFLKNMIQSMNAIELIEVYKETSEEVSYYKKS